MWAGNTPTQIVSSTPTPVQTITPPPTASSAPTPTPSPSPSAAAVSVSDARAAYTAKDYLTAISLYTKAVLQAQGAVAIAQLQYELGNSYRENKQNDLALSSYGLAVAQNPKLVVAYQARANLLIALKRRDEAKTTLQNGLDANPGNKDLQNDLSTIDLNGPSGDQ
jgi:tetratricopeptide (TPR) repeat protein